MVLVGALVVAGLAVGIGGLLRRPASPAPITTRDLAQAAAADQTGPQMSLWRADPGRSVMLFGLAVKTGAFFLPDQGELTLRALVVDRGGGFAPNAAGKLLVARKVGGQIKTVAEVTRAELNDPAWTDVVLKPGDVVYAE